MTYKPRCALVFSGLSRMWWEAYPAFKEYFIDRYETTVYACLWTEAGYYSGKNYLQSPSDKYVKLAEGDRGFHDSGEIMDVKKFIEAYHPAEMKLLDFKKFDQKFQNQAAGLNGYTRPKNTIAQAFMVQQAMNLLPERASFDFVVRARPDIVLESDPGTLSYQWDQGPMSFDTMYTLASRNKEGKGTGDSIQISNLRNSRNFANMYDNIHNLYHISNVSCPHLYTEHWIIQNNMHWQELNCGAHVAHSPAGLYTDPT
jgi:hypothetical protein